jgi:S-methylmethionine-dependent homocysteine/selenocysteine methylase
LPAVGITTRWPCFVSGGIGREPAGIETITQLKPENETMSKYRNNLPQLNGGLFLTDSGMETFLYFQQGIDLPEFAAFPLLETEQGRRHIGTYMERHIRIAVDNGLGFILETPTWRANRVWGAKLGYDRDGLARVNRDAVRFLSDLCDVHETAESRMVISGNIGPRGDGYNPEEILGPDEAQAYHADQVESFTAAGADLVTTLTMTHVGEAVGITRAAQAARIPVVISFTTETDGRIPTGQTLGEAIEEVDSMTDRGPAYYMVNCAHPTHFDDALRTDAAWIKRLRGIRANASTKSHAELDESTELDEGNPKELGTQYRAIRERLPHVTVVGGCCGTDHRHVEQICAACRQAA